MRVACSQFSPKLFEINLNRDHVLKDMKIAAKDGVELIVFPECALTGYVIQAKEDLKRINAESVEAALQSIAQAAKQLSLTVVLGTLEYVENHWVNSCYFIDKHGAYERQLKNHLPQIGADRFVQEGRAAAKIFQVDSFKVGIMICYEARFPEIARSLALEGIDILLHPTNLPMSSNKVVDFILPVRAMENKIYVMSANRTGEENGVTFLGHSKIFDVNGDVLSGASQSSCGLIYATLSLDRVKDKTLNFSLSAPHSGISDIYQDRRPKLYSEILLK